MPILPVYDWLGVDITRRQKWVINATAAVVAVFVLIDWGVIHPHIWNNDPGTMYWVAKPIVVGGFMLVAAWFLRVREGFSRGATLALSGLVGIVYLQLYYTIVPVPIDGGPSIQIGLLGNLTEGLVVHFGGLAIGVVAVLVLYRYV